MQHPASGSAVTPRTAHSVGLYIILGPKKPSMPRKRPRTLSWATEGQNVEVRDNKRGHWYLCDVKAVDESPDNRATAKSAMHCAQTQRPAPFLTANRLEHFT